MAHGLSGPCLGLQTTGKVKESSEYSQIKIIDLFLLIRVPARFFDEREQRQHVSNYKRFERVELLMMVSE